LLRSTFQCSTFQCSTFQNSIDDAIPGAQLPDALYGPVDYARELGRVIFPATLP
jgi:hypothetical protein